jgi:hypothetical protein
VDAVRSGLSGTRRDTEDGRGSVAGRRISLPGVTRATAIIIAALAVVAACARSDGAQLADSAARTTAPARVVDSVRSLEEDLRRFRAGLPEAPERLSGGAESREELVRRFIDAVARSDSGSLAAMALTRAEFAYLVYPSSPYTGPPYRQSPEIVWLLLRAEHDKGFTRLIRRVGGQQVAYLGHRCEPEPLREGENRLWRGCRVRVRIGAEAPRERQLFGVIVERHGHFKFASYRTDF